MNRLLLAVTLLALSGCGPQSAGTRLSTSEREPVFFAISAASVYYSVSADTNGPDVMRLPLDGGTTAKKMGENRGGGNLLVIGDKVYSAAYPYSTLDEITASGPVTVARNLTSVAHSTGSEILFYQTDKLMTFPGGVEVSVPAAIAGSEIVCASSQRLLFRPQQGSATWQVFDRSTKEVATFDLEPTAARPSCSATHAVLFDGKKLLSIVFATGDIQETAYVAFPSSFYGASAAGALFSRRDEDMRRTHLDFVSLETGEARTLDTYTSYGLTAALNATHAFVAVPVAEASLMRWDIVSIAF